MLNLILFQFKRINYALLIPEYNTAFVLIKHKHLKAEVIIKAARKKKPSPFPEGEDLNAKYRKRKEKEYERLYEKQLKRQREEKVTQQPTYIVDSVGKNPYFCNF